MSKPSHRDKILDAGLAVFHSKGFHASGVQDVVSHAGVPKGSFYNHFDSKEALGISVLERYWQMAGEALAILENENLPPLDRIEQHFAALGYPADGCLVGNFTAELSRNDQINAKLAQIWHHWETLLTLCLATGQNDGSVRQDLPAAQLARTALALWEGSVLMSRVERDCAPLESVRHNLRRLLAR